MACADHLSMARLAMTDGNMCSGVDLRYIEGANWIGANLLGRGVCKLELGGSDFRDIPEFFK